MARFGDLDHSPTAKPVTHLEPEPRLPSMRLTDDLTNPRAILAKGWLFLLLGFLAAGGLLALHPGWRELTLLAIAIWAFCRWYYFMFYVIEHYVDPSFKFAGLTSFLRYLQSSKRQA